MREFNKPSGKRYAGKRAAHKRVAAKAPVKKAAAKPSRVNYVVPSLPEVHDEYTSFSTLPHGADILGTVHSVTAAPMAELVSSKDRTRRLVSLQGYAASELPSVGDVFLEGSMTFENGKLSTWETVASVFQTYTVDIDTDRGDTCVMVLREHTDLSGELTVMSKDFH